MVQFICTFYSKEIILEQFIMKWIDPFYGLCHICSKQGGILILYLSKTRLESTCHIIFPKREYHAKIYDWKKWFTVASMD